MMPATVVRRDGSRVPFDPQRIERAITRALGAVRGDEQLAGELARVAADHIARSNDAPALELERVQDAVVHVLQESGQYEAAIAFARYRDERERFRRTQRLSGETAARMHLHVVDDTGRRRPWDRAWLAEWLGGTHGLDARAAEDALVGVEDSLAGSAVSELSAPLLLALVDAALVRCGRAQAAVTAAPLRIDRAAARRDALAADGLETLLRSGRRVHEQLTLAEGLPAGVVRHWCRGRLWIDGLDDPRRGAQLTATVDGGGNPWQILTNAFALAAEAQGAWRKLRLVLPPAVLGHLERGAMQLVPPLRTLALRAQVFLYCDGRTPLIDHWPFGGAAVSLATYNDDFLLLRRLDELGLGALSGPHLLSGGYRGRVAVLMALNAQGLDGEWSQLDELAMTAAAAVQVRLRQLAAGGHGDLGDAELRFALTGLPHGSDACAYLERQVVQEGQRIGQRLVRTASLTEDACAHLGRLLG
jgi:hypothetical protein